MGPAVGRFVVVVTALLFDGCSSQRQPDQTHSEAPSAVSSVAGSNGFEFGLAPGSCTEGKCRAVLQLTRKNQLVDSVPLEFAASEGHLRKEEGETGLTTHQRVDAWTAGKEEGAVTTALRAINLTANRSGVLVYQVGGFEHIKRRYDIFVAESDKLKRVWSVQEGQGPVWSSVEVAAGTNGNDIIYLNVVPAQGNAPDKIEAQRLTWDDATKSLKAQPIAELPAVVAGNFSTVEAARRAASGTCLSTYWVLPGDVITKTSSHFLLAMVSVDKQTAEAELERPCDTKLARRIAVFNAK